MHIEVVDPGGHGLGLSIGLVELGHRVRYRGAVRAAPAPDDLGRMRHELAARFFAADGDERDDEAPRDLLVLVDVFADYLGALERGYEHGRVADYFHPLQDDAGIAVYPHRLEYYIERAVAAEHVVVVDTSDRRAPREVAFELLPQAQLFAREAAARERWQPLPFLYNTAMLWLEFARERDEWFVPASRRPRDYDWVFCGTIDHPRYRGAREEALRAVPGYWPGARGLVQAGVAFCEVLALLQSSRCGLDLPGAGELCFRLHECLALGVPVWRPFGGRVQLPSGLAQVVVRDPVGLPELSPEQVREVYQRHYAPAAAARWLLERVYRSQSTPATNIAPAASR